MWLSSVQFSHSVMSDSLQPHESQHTRPPCPSPTPRVHPDSRPLSQWCPAPPYEMKHNVLETYIQHLSACGSAWTRKSAASGICHSERQKSVLDNWIHLPLFVVKCWPHAIMIATVGRKCGYHYLSMSVLKALGPETSPSHTFFLPIPARFGWRNLWLEPHNSLWE